MAFVQTSLAQRLRALTLLLLDDSRPAFSLRSEVLELKDIFEAAGGMNTEPEEDIASGETVTAAGIAISPTMASMCLDDFARTVQFLRGTHAAITELDEKIDDRPVHVLYVGCGPWAPLAIPLMSVFTAAEVTFSLLDIHPESIDSVHSIINSLELFDRLTTLKTADAATCSIEGDATPDVILIEMMRAGLEAEPQVAVAMNLLHQAPNVVLIPQEIRLELALVNSLREFVTSPSSDEVRTPERDRVEIGSIIVLTREGLGSRIDQQTRSIPAASLRIPEFDPVRYRPMILTTVHVYQEHLLKDYDSGITCPRPLHMREALTPGATVDFSYEMGTRPGLRASRS